MGSNYIKANIITSSEYFEILYAELSELGFEGFIENEGNIEAYINADIFNEKEFYGLLNKYQISIDKISIEKVKQQNWNALWESSFEPIMINSDVLITAPFHNVESECKYNIIIQPKTSFGTGHHETTRLMIEMMIKEDFNNKVVFDFGSGTGILSIFASKLGSKQIDAIDIDEWAAENILENMKLNNTTNITFYKNSLEQFDKNIQYDLILANINKNILIDSFEKLSKYMKNKAILIISGFYHFDLSDIVNESKKYRLEFKDSKTANDWCCALLKKF